MNKFFDNVIVKKRVLIVNEQDIMGLLRVFDKVNDDFRNDVLMNMDIGNCGWADEPNKWFVMFSATDRKWRRIITEIHNNYKMIMLKEDNRLYLI